MTTATISVVCITHRKGELLRAAITGVAEQLLPGDELLIVDDGGEDWPVVADVMNAGGEHRSLRYVRVPHQGYRLSLMCNIGVQRSARSTD